jgi:hypothetical protein
MGTDLASGAWSSLVGSQGQRSAQHGIIARVDGRAAGQQRYRLSGAAVVLKQPQLGIERRRT